MSCPAAVSDELQQRMAELMGVLNATTAALVGVVGEALDTEAWAQAGIRSAEHWVTWQCGVSPARARNLLRMARRLPDLAENQAAFAAGSLSEDQAGLVARHCPPERDAEVAGLAQLMLVPQLRKLLSCVPPPEPAPEPTPAATERRNVAFGADEDGNLWLRAFLPPDQGAVVQRALETARDQLLAERSGDGETSVTVGWDDALVRTAELSLGALERGSPLRNQVLVHLEAESLRTHLHGGPALPDWLGRLMTCDANLRAVVEAAGVPVAMGIASRTVDDRLRALVHDRDRGCRVPGCAQVRWVEVHHLIHWEDGGPTRLDNLCCLCPSHHRMHHAGQLTIAGDPTRPDGLVFSNAAGIVIGAAKPRPPGDPPAPAARRAGVPEPRWVHPLGERVDWRWFAWN